VEPLRALRSVGLTRYCAYDTALAASALVVAARDRHDAVLRLLDFDMRLRSLLLRGLAEFELRLRADVVDAVHLRLLIGDRSDWLDERLYAATPAGRGAVGRVRSLISTSPPPPPMGVVIESVTMGVLFRLVESFADEEVRWALTRRLHMPKPSVLISVIRSLTTLRNRCAHHDRLWGAPMALAPQVPHRWDEIADARSASPSWRTLLVLAGMIDRIRSDSTFSTELRRLVTEDDLTAAGFGSRESAAIATAAAGRLPR
jgi:abortive infection bacteriophage resistance protein